MTEVTVATKIGSEELKRIDTIIRRLGLLNRSDFVREAIRLYLSLSSLESVPRSTGLQANLLAQRQACHKTTNGGTVLSLVVFASGSSGSP